MVILIEVDQRLTQPYGAKVAELEMDLNDPTPSRPQTTKSSRYFLAHSARLLRPDFERVCLRT